MLHVFAFLALNAKKLYCLIKPLWSFITLKLFSFLVSYFLRLFLLSQSRKSYNQKTEFSVFP